MNAVAPRADEGRDKLPKAMGRSKYPINHGCPNEGTQLVEEYQLSIHKKSSVCEGNVGN